MNAPILRASASGLRNLASGGVEAGSAYHQITDHLGQTLGPEAAAFFAEPSPVDNGREILWYAASEEPARRLVDLAGPERLEAARRFTELAGRIDRHAGEMISGASGEEKTADLRHLGQMIRLALQIPDESHIWVAGRQPILTFWGYLPSDGDPLRAPIYKLPPSSPALSGAEAGPKAPLPPDPPQKPWLRWALWASLAGILLAIFLILLRVCSLAWPGGAPGSLADFCGSGRSEALAAENRSLSAENDALRREWAQAERACRPESPPPAPAPQPPETPRPDPIPPTPPDQAPEDAPESRPESRPESIPESMPDQTPGRLSFHEAQGCWRTDPDALRYVDQSTGEDEARASFSFCLDGEDGSGRLTMREGAEESPGIVCSGPLQGAFAAEAFSFEHSALTCSDGGTTVGGSWSCRLDDQGLLTCSGVAREQGGEVEVEPKTFRRSP